eukprot:g43448.t1
MGGEEDEQVVSDKGGSFPELGVIFNAGIEVPKEDNFIVLQDVGKNGVQGEEAFFGLICGIKGCSISTQECVNDLNKGTDGIAAKFADDTELERQSWRKSFLKMSMVSNQTVQLHDFHCSATPR